MTANLRRMGSGAWTGSVRTIAALALVAALSALALRAVSSAHMERADFTWVNAAEVTSLDPATTTGIPEGRVLRFLFEGLCVKDPASLAPVPGAAESWVVAQDGLTYTFHLRSDARWTNGDPVTAHDFVASFERLLDPATGAEYAYQLWCVRGARAFTNEVDAEGRPVHGFDTVAIRASDVRTLVIELDYPVPYFLDLCGSCALMPVHVASLRAMKERAPDTWSVEWMRPENLVTNGPYRIQERRVNDRIRFVKNESYWDRENVAFETVDCLTVEHSGTMLNLYLSGEVGWIDDVPGNLATELLEREDLHPAPYLATAFYRFNVTRPPFDDRRVRRALALCVDRRAITTNVTRAGEIPTFAFVPPGLPGYTGASMQHAQGSSYEEDFARDVAEARALLAEAGYGPGARPLPAVEIHYNTQGNQKDVAEVIADGWRRHLGLQVKFLNQEWKVFLAAQRSLAYDVSRSSWIGDYPDAQGFLDIFARGSENNRTGWSDPRYDALLARALRANSAERAGLLAEAEALLLEALPILPLYVIVTTNLVDPRLGGFGENVLDEHFPKFWYWMDDAELERKRASSADGKAAALSHGPPQGLYPPARRAAPRTDPR